MSTYTSTILVTGGTLGLGYWTAYELAKRFTSARVIVASRSNPDKADETLAVELAKENKLNDSQRIVWMKLDLGSTAEVRKFVSDFEAASFPPISHLIMNAGLQYHNGKELRLSPEGIESTFAINHVGHALLFFLLKPHLSPDARMVITASGTHDPAQKTGVPDAVYETAELMAHPVDGKGYAYFKGAQRYASSKLSNVLFTYALEKRLKQGRAAKRNNWTVAAFDPGLMPATGLARDAGAVMFFIIAQIASRLLWLLRLITRTQNVHTPQESGYNQATLAGLTSESAAAGQLYWEGDKPIDTSVASHDESKQEDLWKWTVDFLASDEAEKKAFETF